jgi:group II intron reverse transcriptase/maturase
MCENSRRENREIPQVSPQTNGGERSVKANGRTPDMYACGKSDVPIVPSIGANKAVEQTAAESKEGRGTTKGNADQTTMSRTQSWTDMTGGLERVREAAIRDGRMQFTALLHHVCPELLWDGYMALKRLAAPGVDEVTWQEYYEDAWERIKDLHARIHRGAYRPLPSLRVWAEKPDGRKRPLGVAALEDKIVQQAVRTILEQIYEVDFLGFSYGFRPDRSCHNALDALTVAVTRKKVNYVLDADIRGFFDAINQGWLERFLEHRIGDRRILRLIRKWLRAGVVDDGVWSETEEGTAQGAVISPLLANVFLHYVFDLWVNQWRKRTAGDVIVVRYADDFIVGFQHRRDAERFLRELRQRLEKFGLELHPEKTRLIEFGRFAAERRRKRGEGKPETFDFLGFTHVCGKTNKNGKFQVIRRSIAKRMRAKLKDVKDKLRRRMHEKLPDVGRWLRSTVQGWLNYHAVPGNYQRLIQFRRAVARLWLRTIRRRSQKGRSKWNWERFYRVADPWLPKPRITHPYPGDRFDVRPKVGAV